MFREMILMWKFARCLAAAGIAATGAFFVSATTATEAAAKGKHAPKVYATLPNGQILKRKPGGHAVVNGRKPGGHKLVNGRKPGGLNVVREDRTRGYNMRFMTLADARAGKGVGGLKLESRQSPSGMIVKRFRCEWVGTPCPFGYSLNPIRNTVGFVRTPGR